MTAFPLADPAHTGLTSMPAWRPGSRDRVQISGMLDVVPVLGTVKMGLEALTGRDRVGGTCLSGGERLLRGAGAMLPVIGSKLSRGVSGLWSRFGRAGRGAGEHYTELVRVADAAVTANLWKARDIVLGPTRRGILSKFLAKVATENRAAGLPAPTVATNAVTHNAAGFGRELSQAPRIHWSGMGVELDNDITLAEWDFIVKHRDLWAKTIIHLDEWHR